MRYLLVLALVLSVYGDEVVRRADGSEVILKDDGTWSRVEVSPAPEQEQVSMDVSCESLIVDSTDPMTGIRSLSYRAPVIVSADGNNGFGILLFKRMGRFTSLIWSTTVVGASSCIAAEAKINILYEDGTRDEVVTNGKFNCDGSATVFFGGVFGKEMILDRLCSKRIKTMRVWTMKSFVQEDFPQGTSTKILRMFQCLRNKE